MHVAVRPNLDQRDGVSPGEKLINLQPSGSAGYSEMLREDAEATGSAESLPDLNKIHSAGKHLLGLISDILDLSKIEAGRMELHLEVISVPELVSDLTETIRPVVEKNGNTLIVR